MEPETAGAIAESAGTFLQQLDLIQRRALFVRLAEPDLRAASFLDERLGLKGREGFWIPQEDLVDLAARVRPNASKAAFIFHIGHCGSTLLSRLLDRDPGVLGLREPLALRELAEAERELGHPLARLSSTQWQDLFGATLALLGRRFSEGQRIVIKATSSCNNLAHAVLAREEPVRLVLMYMPLESYLATMVKAPSGGLDALHAAPARLQFLHEVLGEDSIRLHGLQAAEIVAMGWVSELLRFTRLAAAPATARRALLLDFEALLGDPAAHLDVVRSHLGLAQLPDDNATLAQSSVMRAYAKSPSHPYSPADRRHDLDLSRRMYGEQIARGMAWAEALLRMHPACEGLGSLLR